MKQRSRATVLLWGTLLGCLMLCLTLTPLGWAQQSQGTVTVSVLDPTGGVIPGAQLKLVDVATNDTREATTQDAGNYTFVNLNLGSYKLTVTKDGFETQTYNVVVQAARITDVKATMKVGSTSQVVEVVGSAVPLVETTSSAVNTNIDIKQIEDLPLSGRTLSRMAYLTAGYNGTWNGLPTSAQSSSIDGVIGASGRWKYGTGADGSAVAPRVENIAEMVVSTNQLDMNNGFGTSNMTITYVTRRGSNDFHGRLYEDFRNDALNAKGWNQVKKSKLRLNEFGGSLGGPIFKDKLFFFGSFSMSKRPNSFDVTNTYFLPEAQQGIYKWTDETGTHSVNVFNTVAAYNAANKTSFPTSPNNTMVQQQMSTIAGLLNKGTVLPSYTEDDPNIAGLTWKQNNPDTYYYPTVRLDYNLSQKHRINFAYNQTLRNNKDYAGSFWPGDGKTGSNTSNNFTASLGLESTLTPTFINSLKIGYLYSSAKWPTEDNSYFDQNAQIADWGYGTNMSGQNYFLPTSRMQPVINIKNDATWVKGKHTLGFGFSAYRDQNTYWDALTGIPTYHLGVNADVDPVANALSTSTLSVPDEQLWGARQLYAILTGRVDGVWGRYTYDPTTGKYGEKGKPVYNKLNELMKAWGFSGQDSYKILPNLTLNYGIRVDFTGTNKDRDGKYHSLTPEDMFGPSGVWNLFNPGSLKGINDPIALARSESYNSWNGAPQPAFGLAWSPRSNGSIFERLLGGDKTVIRAGYSLRKFTMPQQFVWDAASNYSTGLFQDFWADPGTTPGVGVFAPGSVALGDALPNVVKSPSEYAEAIHMSEYTFGGSAYAAVDPKIRQPYVQSWNFGIQRDLGHNRALEVRYVGNRTVHQWLAQNINEVNVFENGFLDEFKHAQANLAINGGTSFAPGAAGTYALPIMTAAGVNFTSSDFINRLNQGAVGSLASTLANNRDYFCRLVGSTFGPCGTGFGPGAGYPVNFFVANPYAIGAWTGAKYITDAGMSTYNGLQVELRQQYWHGLNATANYTWSKTLGVATAGDWTGSYTQFTIRNNRWSYAPANTDRNHVVNINATYDLPFGRGKRFLSGGGVLDKVVGGWTVATIVKFQTGSPFRIGGQYQTFNDQTDGGVILNGVTANEIQDHVGVYFVPSTTGATYDTVYWLDPTYAKSLITDKKIVSNTTPGVYGKRLYLHGPSQTFTDVAISKAIPISERVRFKFQAEMLNAFNHPVFAFSNGGIGNAANFGKGSYSGGSPRNIEFRANIEF